MRITGYIKIIFRSFIDFFKDRGPMLAGSMSYSAMMAIVPYCIFLITILGYFLGENVEFYQFFLSKLTNIFPKITSQIIGELERLITYKGLGKFTLILYGLLSYQFFLSIEASLNAIFKIKTKRTFLTSFILALITITMIMAFLLLSFGATSAISMLKTLREFLPGLKISGITGFLIRFVIPFVLVFLTVMIVYLLLPRRKIRFSHALFGAFFTTVFLEAAKHVFTIYVGNFVKFGTIYGPLSVFMMLLLWVFYSSCIFLIGAEIVHNLENSKEG